jgi:hypothetical protein
MNPAPSMAANPSGVNPSALMCEWGAIRGDLPAGGADRGGRALWAIGADVDTVELMAEAGQQSTADSKNIQSSFYVYNSNFVRELLSFSLSVNM